MSNQNNFVQAVFFKISSQRILTPHWRDYQALEGLFDGLKHGEVHVSVVERGLLTFKDALDNELMIINHQLTEWLAQGRLPSRMHFLAVACANLIYAAKDCLIVLKEGKFNNIDLVLGELRKKVWEHEFVRESIISLSEREGWEALQKKEGPFSSVVFMLEWCVTTYVTGYSSKDKFQGQLKWMEDRVRTICKDIETPTNGESLKVMETDLIESIHLVRLSCLGVCENAHFHVDFLELRGLLGVVAKSLSQLNGLANSDTTKAKSSLFENFNEIPLEAFSKIFTYSMH